MHAVFYPTDGEQREIRPLDGKAFSYEELKAFVGYPVEITPLPSGKVLIGNEEGKLTGLPINHKATEIWKAEYPIEKYPLNNDQLIVGNAIVADEALIN